MEKGNESREKLWFEKVTNEVAGQSDYRFNHDLLENQAEVRPASSMTMYGRSSTMACLLCDAHLSHQSRPTRQCPHLPHEQLTAFGDTCTCWDAQRAREWSLVSIHTPYDGRHIANDGTTRRLALYGEVRH